MTAAALLPASSLLLILLAAASVFSWAIILAKFRAFAAAQARGHLGLAG